MKGRIRIVVLGLAWFARLYGGGPEDQAWQTLGTSLYSHDLDRRRQALAALATIRDGNIRAVEACVDALRDRNSLVRASAALDLGRMNAYAAIPALKQALNDKGEVAFAAAKALTELGDQGGRELLASVLAGKRKDIKPGLMTNAIREGQEMLHHPLELIYTGAADASEALFWPAAIAFPAVKDTLDLKGKDAPDRAAAAAYLARDLDPAAISLLESGLEDKNQFVRIEAADGLGQRGNESSIDKLEPLLNDRHNAVRDMAAASIIRIMDRGGTAGAPATGPVIPITSKKTEEGLQ